MQQLNNRQQVILNTLVEHYIEFGQPVSSKVLADAEQVIASPATVRNVMMLLEQQGLLHSPHTSAGRIPTPKGYRVFVEQLLTTDNLHPENLSLKQLQLDSLHTPAEICAQASSLLSQMTHLTGVVSVPNCNQRSIEKIEFVSLTDKRVLAVLVFDDGEIQNRLLDFQQVVNEQVLRQTAQIMNIAVCGKDLHHVRETLITLAEQQDPYLSSLSQLTLDLAEESLPAENQQMLVSGQRFLLDDAITDNLTELKRLFEEVTEKSTLLDIMEECYQAPGVKLFIGDEAGVEVMQSCSLISAPYKVDGEIVGALAVIGPQRMDYSSVISVVDMTAKLLSKALQDKKNF